MTFFKKSLKIILLTSVLTISIWKLNVLAENIPVYLDNQQIELSNDVFIENGRLMVPLRAICEALDYDVSWNGDERHIRISREGQLPYVSFWIDSFNVETLYEEKTTDVAPKILDGRTYVPLRVLVELLGDNITWDDISKTIHMTKNSKYSNIESCGVNKENISYFVPQIMNPSNSEIKINEYFIEHLATEKNKLEYKENISKNFKNPSNFSGCLRYEIKNNQNNILSVYSNTSINLNLDDLTLYEDYCNFDTFYKNTGEKLQITDILKGTNEEIIKIIASTFLPDNMHEEDLIFKASCKPQYTNLTSFNYCLTNFDFYIEDNNLIFLVITQPGSIDGRKYISTSKLSIIDNSNLFKEEFLQNFK